MVSLKKGVGSWEGGGRVGLGDKGVRDNLEKKVAFITMSTPNISSSSSTLESINTFLFANTTQDDHAPLWAYVTIYDKAKDEVGNKNWTCNFCNKSFKSSYSRGIDVCSKVNDEYLAELQLVVDLAKNKVKPKHVSLPTEKDNSSLKRRNIGPLEKSFNTDDRDHLKALIARMFYFSGLSFNLARNPYYVNSYLFAANHNLSGFLSPVYNASNNKRKQIEGSPIFLNFVDASKDIKSKYYIVDRMTKVIKEVGEENVIHVITDNAVASKGTLCVVHTLNLALKNICDPHKTKRNKLVYEECCWITQLVDQVGYVRNFIMSHTMRLAMFNHFLSSKLLVVAETFKFLKRSLESMVISEEWDSYIEGDIDPTTHAQAVKDHILNGVL
ncbi:hypothetical protein Lal_00038587 [Lupinus albus]|nr:hypothetical protein Lal_00038587 [Lupinus albus]